MRMLVEMNYKNDIKNSLNKDDFNDKKMMLKRINTANKSFPLSLPLDLSKGWIILKK